MEVFFFLYYLFEDFQKLLMKINFIVMTVDRR